MSDSESQTRCLLCDRWSSTWTGYIIALLAQVTLFLLVIGTESFIPEVVLRILYLLVVAVIAFMYGYGPAVVAFVVGLFSYSYFLLPPYRSLELHIAAATGWDLLISFALANLIAIIGMLMVRRSLIRSRELTTELQYSRQETQEALERERNFSLLLQRALLPELPTIGCGYATSVLYRPAYETREVGGDFYDIFEIPGMKCAFIIGDVSGKGLEAASMAATTRSTVHAFMHEKQSASEALTLANSVLFRMRFNSDEYVTVFVAEIDLPEGNLRYSFAGHPPGFICRQNGDVHRLKSGTFPLSMLDDTVYKDYSDKLDVGDSLVIYTDGVSEARRGTDLFDLEGIEQVIRQFHYLSVGDLANKIMTAACDWADGKLTDDAAIIVIRRES